jgi:hypothetical protein
MIHRSRDASRVHNYKHAHKQQFIGRSEVQDLSFTTFGYKTTATTLRRWTYEVQMPRTLPNLGCYSMKRTADELLRGSKFLGTSSYKW